MMSGGDFKTPLGRSGGRKLLAMELRWSHLYNLGQARDTQLGGAVEGDEPGTNFAGGISQETV